MNLELLQVRKDTGFGMAFMVLRHFEKLWVDFDQPGHVWLYEDGGSPFRREDMSAGNMIEGITKYYLKGCLNLTTEIQY